MEGHTYVIGATGTGKTNFLLSQMQGAFCFIDKHGVAARQIADAIPCVYWRPADLSYPIGLNPLQNVPPDERWKVVADIVSIFSDVWKLGPETPRLLYYLRASIRVLIDSGSTTLLDIRRLLSDDNFRARHVRRCTDSETSQTWLEYNKKKEQQQAQEIASLQNKVAALADPLPLRFTLGQKTSTISIPKILAAGTPLVVDLSGLGDEPAHLLGALLISQFKQAAEAAKEPHDYTLIIDEFQNFGTGTIATILSEARKWKLHLCIAHQFISQLDEEIRDAVLGNCSTIVSFRIGPEDAPIIGKAIDWNPDNLMELGRGVARMRTIENGVPSRAYLLETEKVELPKGWLEKNVRNTRANFARPRKVAETPNTMEPKFRRSW
jgi:TraM recognition site of TraD and TraG